jgi:hypothetical protein
VTALPSKIKGVLAGALVGGVLFGLVTGIGVSSCGDDSGVPATTKPTKR